MTVTAIKTPKDYRFAISFLNDLEDLLATGVCKDRAKVEEYIREQKRECRRYSRFTPNMRYVCGDYDSYVMLIEFPKTMTIEQAKIAFENNYELHYTPSPYDCTGQHFTTGAKFVERHGRVYCYHSISVDV